jgi:uncharacterized protein YprB with RNaseH-like and TPR domain
MTDLKDKLKGLVADQGVMTGSEWRKRVETMADQRAAGTFEIETAVKGEVVGEEEDGFFLVREDFPLDTAHGHLALGACLEAKAQHIALSARDEDLAEFNPATTYFIDTETTGLMGGTGTVMFLVGVGYFVEGAFRLDQCFMRDFDDEEPMLTFLSTLFSRCETVVSYNGKSFDLPLLRTRFIQNRIPFPLDAAAHYDLVHAARRFWKRRLGKCNLTNIEQHILGIERHGDVPSHLIPQLWLDYLRRRDARPLKPIFYHHKMDILSLVTLTAHVSQCLSGEEGGFDHTEDQLSLVRLHFKEKRYDDVVTQASHVLETKPEGDLLRETLEILATAHRKLNRFEEMEEAWQRCMDQFPRFLLPRLELAKHYEHRKRDLPEAAALCEETITLLQTRSALSSNIDGAPDAAGQFTYRLERIRRKLTKGSPPQEEM